MKTVFVALCVCVFVAANPIQEKWIKVHRECQSDPDLFVDEIIFEKIKKGEKPDLPPNFGDHAFCMLNNLDFQDDDGHVLQAGVRQAVSQSHPNNLDEIVNECSSIKGESEEETALALFGCFGKHKINIGQL